MGGAASCPPKNARPNVDSVAINRHRYILSRAGDLVIARKTAQEKLQALINDADVDVALVKAESGAGKSTLVASVLEDLAQFQPEWIGFSCFIGSTERSTVAFDILAQLNYTVNQTVAAMGSKDFIEQDQLAVNDMFLMQNQLNANIELIGQQFQKQVLLVFDAVNELDSTSLAMTWLPLVPPANCKYLFTTINPESVDPGSVSGSSTKRAYKSLCQRWKFDSSRSHCEHNLLPLTDIERIELFRKLIVSPRNGKAPEFSDACSLILEKNEVSPLYLQLLAQSVKRRFKSQGIDFDEETAKSAITDFPSTITSAYDSLIEDIEIQFGRSQATKVLTSIWVTEGDLFRHQLQEIHAMKNDVDAEDISNSAFSSMLRQRFIENSTYSKVNFVHMQARDAVYRRYLKDGTVIQNYHLELARHFQKCYASGKDDSNRDPIIWHQILRRLPIHLLNCGDPQEIQSLLCNLDFCADKCKAQLLGDLIFNFKQTISKYASQGNINSMLKDYQSLLQASAHILRLTPSHLVEKMILQQAANSHDTSHARREAMSKLKTKSGSGYFAWSNRSKVLSSCKAIYAYPQTKIWVGDFSPEDGKHIAYGASDTMIHIFDIESGDEIMTLAGHTDDISFCLYNPCGSQELITVAPCKPYRKGNDLIVWSTKSGSKIQIFDTIAYCTDCKFSPDGTMLAIVGHKVFCQILQKDPDTLLYVETAKYCVAGATCCTFTSSCDNLIVGTVSTERYVDSDSEEEESKSKKTPIFVYIFSTSVGSKNYSQDDAIAQIDITDGEGVVAMCTLAHSSIELLACATENAFVNIYSLSDLNDISCLLTFNPHDGEALYTIFSTLDGKILVSSEDQTVSIWQISSDEKSRFFSEKITVLRGHSSPVKKVVQHPAVNTTIMTTGDDGTSRIFSIPLAEKESTPPGHLQSISATIFCSTSNGTCIASSDSYGFVRFWKPDGLTLIWETHLKAKNTGMQAITSLTALRKEKGDYNFIIVGMHATVHIINAEDGSICSSSYEFKDWINSVACSNNAAVVAGDNNCLALLSINESTGAIEKVKTFDTENALESDVYNSFLSVSVSNNMLALSGDNGCRVRCWDVESRKEILAFKVEGWVVSVDIERSHSLPSSNIRLGVAGTKGGLLYLFSLDRSTASSSTLCRVSTGESQAMIAWCSFFQGNSYIVANSSGKTIYMYKIIKYGEDAKGKASVDMSLECTFPAFAPFGSPDGIGGQGDERGSDIVSGCQGGRIYLLHWTT